MPPKQMQPQNPPTMQPPQGSFQQTKPAQAFANNPGVQQPQPQTNPADGAKAFLGIATMLQNHLLPKAPQKGQEAPQEQGQDDQKLQQFAQMIAEEFKKQKADTQKMIEQAVGGLRQDIATAIQEEDKNEQKK